MPLLLLAGSAVALALAVVHSWRTRGRFVTLAFFISATLFGILRGNAVWLVLRSLSPDSAGALQPYVPQEGFIPRIGHESVQVALGWVFAMYLAWTVSEIILRRFARFSGRVFMIAGLASLFMCAISWCMETTAVAAGWWYWTLPTKTALFGNVNVAAMEAWFSVVPDFLIPFLVIACASSNRPARAEGTERRAQHAAPLLRYCWLLVFPLHMLAHLAYGAFDYAFVVYYAMELLVVTLAMFSRLAMERGKIEENRVDRPAGAALASAAVVFFAVVALADASSGEAGDFLTAGPMLVMCLLAWRRIPAWAAAVLALAGVAGWAWMGPRALWVLAPVAAYAFLAWHERAREPLALKLAPVAAAVLLSAASLALFLGDMRQTRAYVAAWAEADRLVFLDKPDEAAAEYRRADALRPAGVEEMHHAFRAMIESGDATPEEAVALFEHRMPRLVRDLEEIVRRDPDWVEARSDLVRFYLVEDRIADATEQYREVRRLRPRDPQAAAMLGYFLLREGKRDEAEPVLRDAARSRNAPVEAAINLGVIRFSRGQDDAARKLWEEALRRDPGNPAASANLERLKEPVPRRDIELRWLARPSAGAAAAMWFNSLAALRPGLPPVRRMRLFEEATQLDPNCFAAHVNLSRDLLRSGPTQDRERALWHARRAATIAGEGSDPEQKARAALALGSALAANGKPDEARRTLEEGLKSAPPELVPQFNSLLSLLKPLR